VELGYLANDNLEAHEGLVKDFIIHAMTVADITPPENILNRVFLEDQFVLRVNR
jgi:hypothetical protein